MFSTLPVENPLLCYGSRVCCLSICLDSGVNGNVRKHSVRGEILLLVTGIRSCRLPAVAKEFSGGRSVVAPGSRIGVVFSINN